MAYGDSAARIRTAKEKLIMRKSPGASEDARTIARQQGAKTSRQVETKAKLIASNRVNDAQKNLTRAKMQGADAKLMRSVNPPTFKRPKVEAKPKPTAKSKLTGADITGQKYNTKIKEEAAKIRLKVKMKEKLTPYEKSVLGADAAIKKMNTKPAAKPAATKKPSLNKTK